MRTAYGRNQNKTRATHGEGRTQDMWWARDGTTKHGDGLARSFGCLVRDLGALTKPVGRCLFIRMLLRRNRHRAKSARPPSTHSADRQLHPQPV